jgi:hypothetical protein
MIWAWLSFGLALAASLYEWHKWALAASLYGWHKWAGPSLAEYLYLFASVLFAAIPPFWRRATLGCAVFLAIYAFNPLVFANQVVYVPATLAMFLSYILSRKKR